MSQPDYNKKVLERFRMSDSHPEKTPAEPGVHLSGYSEEEPVRVPYREAIGCLMYLATVSGPDIS